MTFSEFTVTVSDRDIADLKERLAKSRFAKPFVDDWSRGQPSSFVEDLTRQWLHRHDWRAFEGKLNSYPQYLTEIDGQIIHFLHIKSPLPNAIPLLLTHGWPSSVAEYFDIIGPLTDPAYYRLETDIAFDLVIPSLPGYGWSSPLSSPGWDSIRTAKAWASLMEALGYQSYVAHGGDIGALVTREMGILAPKGLLGIHLQQIFAFPKGERGEMDKLTPFEQEGMAVLEKYERYGGYQPIQQKRPGTLAYGLVDSPLGLLAWNSELFSASREKPQRALIETCT
jgi:epoxide hydrolase